MIRGGKRNTEVGSGGGVIETQRPKINRRETKEISMKNNGVKVLITWGVGVVVVPPPP